MGWYTDESFIKSKLSEKKLFQFLCIICNLLLNKLDIQKEL